MPRLLRRVEAIIVRRGNAYGGKACNLAALARAGFPVPAAYALPGEVCQDVLQHVLLPSEQLEELLRIPGPPDPVVLSRIEVKARSGRLPEKVRSELEDAFDHLTGVGVRAFVVRSSSTVEDQEGASGAGLHQSYLNLRTRDAIERAIIECYAGLFDPRVFAYLRDVADAPSASMGVVVQALVPAEASGVTFTANPLTGDGSEMVVNAAYGLGSSVVDGRVSPDTYRLDKDSGDLRDRVLGAKQFRRIPALREMEEGPDAGALEQRVVEEEVPVEERGRFCLDDQALVKVRELGLRAEDHFGQPQDVEWSLAGGTLYLLQSRPITSLAPGVARERRWSSRERRPDRSRHDRARIVWSNINVGEALPGVATPLTWSVLSAFSDLGFRRAFGSLGCSVPKDAELVGNFRGRIYLNLSEFVAIASQVPGLRPRTLLSFGGGGEEARLEADMEQRGYRGFLLRLPLTVSRFVRENYQISARVGEFEEMFEAERARYRHMDVRILSPGGLSKTLRDVESLLNDTGSVMLTCYGNLLMSVVALRTLVRFTSRRDADRIERGLLTGLSDVESAAPGLSLWHIAEIVRGEPAAAETIRSADLSGLRLDDLPEGPTRRALQNFLLAYGFRGAREAEIASPRWREEPGLLFAAIRAHLEDSGGERPVDRERRQRAVREEFEAKLVQRIPGPAVVVVRHLLSLVQRFTRLRERLRAKVTEVLGMYREIALETSRRLAVRDPAYGTDAAFFLTIDETHALLRGDRRSMVSIVRRRRRQYERDVRLPDPPDTFVGYPPEVEAEPAGEGTLSGLGASSGAVEGVARVLRSPNDACDLRSGEILVAPYADVGWSPLFTVASAVVTDLGGPLSHAAVVAREYGVPMVVNVKVGTRVIQTGDRLRVDGDGGAVEVLEPVHEEPRP
ncbi:MAG: PEP/pyruvate-binding domain-containing protein [Myxococcota bacterium]